MGLRKNRPLKLEDFTDSSNKKVRWIKVWWICKEKQHSYKQSIYDRNRGRGCTICRGKKASPEYNLKVCNPDIAEEWDYEKNRPDKPEGFRPQSNKKVWWICKKKQHSYPARINDRNGGTGCRECYLEGRK